MKSHLKRHFSLLLAVLLVLTMIPVSTIKVSAKATTAATTAKQTAKKADKKTTKKKTKKKTKKTKKAKKQRTVFIAAGHQQRGISSTERLAPGSSRRKAKLTSGTAGVRTHIPNLRILSTKKKKMMQQKERFLQLSDVRLPLQYLFISYR